MPTTGAEPGAIGLAGGCLCGAVRYRLTSAPTGAGWCHCRTCQLNSGSPAMTFASITLGDMIVEQGEGALRRVNSSETGERWFCGECGTPLWMQDKVGAASRDFSLATLDHPEAVEPGFHMFYASRIPWADTADDLPRYPRSRSEGLG